MRDGQRLVLVSRRGFLGGLLASIAALALRRIPDPPWKHVALPYDGPRRAFVKVDDGPWTEMRPLDDTRTSWGVVGPGYLTDDLGRRRIW